MDAIGWAGAFYRRSVSAVGRTAWCNLSLAAALGFASGAVRGFAPRRSFEWAIAAHRALFRCGSHWLASRVSPMIEAPIRRACTSPGAASLFEQRSPGSRGMSKPGDAGLECVGMVLKTPSRHPGGRMEKGVLLLKNNERIEWFRRSVDVASLLLDYRVVLEPSWSSYATPPILAWCSHAPHPVIVTAPAEADHGFLERLDSNLVPIPLGAGDWVDPSVFRPLGRTTRHYDAVTVARLCHSKRLGLLFRALERLADPTFRVAILVAGGPSPARRELLSEIRYGSHSRQIDCFENLKPAAVNEMYNDAKVNLLLSRQEGANRSIFEGFFAGTPGLLTAGHLSVPHDRFVPSTGRIVADRELPAALAHFRDHWGEYDPRRWALENIAADVSSKRLQALLERIAREQGEPWTKGILMKCNVPELRRYPMAPTLRGLVPMSAVLERYPRRESP